MRKKINKIISETPVVILAGGAGARLGSNNVIPKPMVEINGKPVLFYIIGHYVKAGFKKFIVCAGYGIEIVEEFVRQKKWDVRVVNTGVENKTGSRVAQIKSLVNASPMFCLTYGDTVSDINLFDLVSFHIKHLKMGTLAAVHVPIRFRILGLYGDESLVRGFAAKPILQNDYINGGYYVFSNSIFNLATLTPDDNCTLETDVLEDIVAKKELYAFIHNGFWQHIDTDRDRQIAASWFSKNS